MTVTILHPWTVVLLMALAFLVGFVVAGGLMLWVVSEPGVERGAVELTTKSTKSTKGR